MFRNTRASGEAARTSREPFLFLEKRLEIEPTLELSCNITSLRGRRSKGKEKGSSNAKREVPSDSVSSGYPNTEKRVENTTRSGVFLTEFRCLDSR